MCLDMSFFVFFFFKQKTAYDMRISDWSSDVCSSDLDSGQAPGARMHDRAGRCAVPAGGLVAPCRRARPDDRHVVYELRVEQRFLQRLSQQRPLVSGIIPAAAMSVADRDAPLRR